MNEEEPTTNQDGVLTPEALQKFLHTLYHEPPAPSNRIPYELTTPEWRRAVEERKRLNDYERYYQRNCQHYYPSIHEMEMNMNEAYRTAIQQIKDRCEAHKAEYKEYPVMLEVDDSTWETLRSGIHASKVSTHLVIPLLEDVPIAALSQQSDTIRPLHMVTIVKEEKPA